MIIEYPTGSIREGKTWKTKMKCNYGRVPKTVSTDRCNIDVYIRDNPGNGKIYCILQIKENGQFDEEKFMIGFSSKEEAKKMYLEHIPEKLFGGIAEITIEQFKKRFNV